MTITRKALRLSKSAERSVITLTLIVYAALLAYVIPRHEPWADEAQAWELAKWLSLKSLFGTYIHYECTPGLWHLLLWLLARMHVTYGGMHWISGVIALGSMVLLTLEAPFPLPLRLLLPFTYFFVFQYAVVARSYILFPLILFALACIWPSRQKRSFAVAVLLGLLANVSVDGFAAALGVIVVLAIERYPCRAEDLPRWKQWIAPVLLLAAMLAFAAWCIMPARDAGWLVIAEKMRSPDASAALVNMTRRAEPAIRFLPFHLELAFATQHQFIHVLSHALADKFHLGLITWALLMWRLKKQSMLRYSIPAVFLAVLGTFTPYLFYHAGLLWVLFLFLWWITWPEKCFQGEAKWTEAALLISVALCIAIHLIWATAAIRYDASMPYSPGRDGAVVLQSYINRGYKVDGAVLSKTESERQGQYFITDMEPYFATEPFSNKAHRFWFWGGEDMRTKYIVDSGKRSSVVVVDEGWDDELSKAEERRLELIGYKRAKVVCGQAYYPYQPSAPVCHVFYEPQTRQGPLE
jgi:hypothetical protein